MLKTLIRGEKSLSRAIFRRARHLEKDYDKIVELYQEFESARIERSDSLRDMAVEIGDLAEKVIGELAEVIHKDFQIEYQHLKTLYEISYNIEKRIEKADSEKYNDKFKDKEVEEIRQILKSIKGEIERIINYVQRVNLFEKPANVKGQMTREFNNMYKEMEEDVRDVMNFSKKLRKLERLTVKNEKKAQKAVDLVMKEHAGETHQNLLETLKKLNENMNKGEKAAERMILYDLLDLYYLSLGAKMMVDKVKKPGDFPHHSLETIEDTVKNDIFGPIKQETEDLIIEARKILSKEERIAA